MADQCLPMVQYAAEISDNIGKFNFATTYNYDIKFRLKKQIKPSLKWKEIDNALWTKCFSGAGRESYLSGAPVASRRPEKQDHRTCHDFNFAKCTRTMRRFLHKCCKCFKLGHSQQQCFKHQTQGPSTLATTQHPNISASNSNTSG